MIRARSGGAAGGLILLAALAVSAVHAGVSGQQVSRGGEPAVDTMALRAHTFFLSHDVLGGRGTLSPGERAAAVYIASQLTRAGLRPLAAHAESSDPDASDPGAAVRTAGALPADARAMLLPLPLLRVPLTDARITIAGRTFLHGRDFVVQRAGVEALATRSGAVRWVDSLGAVRESTEGEWLVVDDGAAPDAASILALERGGAAGVIVRTADAAAVEAWQAHLGPDRLVLEESDAAPVWGPRIPIILAGPVLSERLAEMRDTAARSTLAFEPGAAGVPATSWNVAAIVPGSDAARAGRYLVYTAHYDHLGVREQAGDSIYNGFSDNAAGTAMLLELARRIAEEPLPVTTLFLFLSGEERGLLGSRWFVASEVVPSDSIHAVVNLDAGAPPAPPTRWRLAGGTRSWAGQVAAGVIEREGWAVRMDAGSANSDHWPFASRGVPAVFLIPDGGWEGLDEAEADALRARWDHYHQPQDEWHPHYPFAGLARYATLALRIGRALAAHEAVRAPERVEALH